MMKLCDRIRRLLDERPGLSSVSERSNRRLVPFLTWSQLVVLLDLGPEGEAEVSPRERYGDTATALIPAEDQ
jgi:hypothetical protein